MTTIQRHVTDQSEAMRFAKEWALKKSGGKIANLARAYLAVCRDVINGVKPQVLRWGGDQAEQSQAVACLYAVCGCGIIHTGMVASIFICPHCRKRGVKAGLGPGEFAVMMMTKPRSSL